MRSLVKHRPIDSSIWNEWNCSSFYISVRNYLRGRPIRNVVDIGAGVGVASLYFLDLFDIDNIICFEPEVDNFSMLTCNVTEADCYNVGIFYGCTESVAVGVGDNNPLGNMVSAVDKKHYEYWEHSIIAYDKVFTLVELESIIIIPVDLIKIDVEGSEYNIIENSSLVKTIPWLLIEFHNHYNYYVDEFIRTNLTHKIIFSEGDGIYTRYLLEDENLICRG